MKLPGQQLKGAEPEESPLFQALLQAAAFSVDAVPAAGLRPDEAAGGTATPSARAAGSAALERVIGPRRGPLAVARSPQKQSSADGAKNSKGPGGGLQPPRPPDAILAEDERKLLLLDTGLVCRRIRAEAKGEAAGSSGVGEPDAVAVRNESLPPQNA